MRDLCEYVCDLTTMATHFYTISSSTKEIFVNRLRKGHRVFLFCSYYSHIFVSYRKDSWCVFNNVFPLSIFTYSSFFFLSFSSCIHLNFTEITIYVILCSRDLFVYAIHPRSHYLSRHFLHLHKIFFIPFHFLS